MKYKNIILTKVEEKELSRLRKKAIQPEEHFLSYLYAEVTDKMSYFNDEDEDSFRYKFLSKKLDKIKKAMSQAGLS